MNFEGICVGVIAKPVGIKGQVKIRPYTTSPESFLEFSEFFLEDGISIAVRSPKINEKGEIVTYIEGYSDRTSVESLHLKEIFIKRESLKSLPEGEYYFEDLKGLDVFNQRLEKIGKVNAALDYGAGTFLDITIKDSKIATLPFNKDSIIEVDLNSRILKINDSYILV